MLGKIVGDVKSYLKKYFKRNQPESGFSEEKEGRVGESIEDEKIG